MSFEKYTDAQYRALDAEGFEARKAEVVSLLEDAQSGVAIDDLRAESEMIAAEAERRNTVASVRSANVAKVAAGAGNVVERAIDAPRHDIREVESTEDFFASDEYNRAFMGAMLTGEKMPEEIRRAPEYQKRADEYTMVVGTKVDGNVVPTNLMDRIVMEQKNYGQIYAGVTKTSFPGGVAVPTMSTRPAASWITEAKTSDDQKLLPDDNLTFSYHGLEVKLAQSFLTSAVTLSSFQDKFVELAAEARTKAIETAIISGTGTGQPLGITADTRVTNKATLTASTVNTWKGWHEQVKAKMKPAYRDGVFIMNQATFDAYIDGMVDSNGQPVARMNYGIDGEELDRFMGRKCLLVDDILPDFAAAESGAVFAIYMRLADYAINSSLPLRATRWTDEDNNLDKYKLLEFLDGKLLDPYGVITVAKGA